MTWIHAFELMCYLLCAIMLANLIRKRDWNSRSPSAPPRWWAL